MRKLLVEKMNWSLDSCAAPQSETHCSRRALVGDDHEDLSTLYRIGLESVAFECDIACNGETAVTYCIQRLYDVILMDFHLPDTTGCNAARRIRLLPEYEAVPIVGCSAADGVRELCLSAGMNVVLSKPVSLGKLVETGAALLLPMV